MPLHLDTSNPRLAEEQARMRARHSPAPTGEPSPPAPLHSQAKSAEENVEVEPFEYVRPKNAYVVFKDGHLYFYHVHRRLKKKLNTHRWHVRRYAGRMPRPETFQAVAERDPNAIQKLVAKAWCEAQIMWPIPGALQRPGGAQLLSPERALDFRFAAIAAERGVD
jgi:hypothetical protein